MNRRLFLGLIVLVSVGAIAQTTIGPVIVTAPPPPPMLPPVTVTATNSFGGTVLCTGEACGWVLDSMQNQWNQDQWDSQGPTEDLFVVDNTQFCNQLRANRPSNCSMSSPPSSPGISSSWQPNTCGSGPISSAFGNAVLNATSLNYSNNLNAPYAGVSFANACNGHDQCYAYGMDKGSCDFAFLNDMMAGCAGVVSSSGRSTCEGFAGTYFGTVSNSPVAYLAYNTSYNGRMCALWVYDMQNNGCGASQ